MNVLCDHSQSHPTKISAHKGVSSKSSKLQTHAEHLVEVNNW